VVNGINIRATHDAERPKLTHSRVKGGKQWENPRTIQQSATVRNWKAQRLLRCSAFVRPRG